MLDILIRGGEVVDGSGSPRRRADVGISNGRIVAVGKIDDAACRTIDAEGRIVAPGFIDVHTHYDAQVFWDPYLTPSILHGVTTVIGGNCGFTIAPLVSSEADYLCRLLAKVEGMPLEALQHGLPWDWTTSEEFFDRLDGRLGINAGFMVGHSTMRRVVMGPASTERAATTDELEAMRRLLVAGLEAGGFGFSSSWGGAHNDPDGVPVPSRAADRDELIILASVCRDFEGTALEFIPSGVSWAEGSRLMADMSAAAGRHLNWNLLRVSASMYDDAQEKLEAGSLAKAAGGRVVALTMPKPLLMRYCFRMAFLLDTIPGWAGPMNLPLEDKLALFRDPVRRRELEELSTAPGKQSMHAVWATRRIEETFSPSTKTYEGRVVGDIAAEEGKRPFEVLADIACADDLRTVFTNIPPEPTDADWAAQRAVWRDDRALIGGSDAGAHLDFLSTFNLQTWFLGHVVRDRQVISLEEAVHHFTGAPAALYGLRDRGRLAEGAWADVVVFDERTVGSQREHTRFDLPGGAGRLYADPIGIERVLVNGVEVVADGELDDARPGRLLRSGRDSYTPALDAAWSAAAAMADDDA